MPKRTTTTYKRYRKYKRGGTEYKGTDYRRKGTEDYKSKKRTDMKRRTEKRYRKRVDEPMYRFY
jgi:hypothetical protein